MDSFEQYGELMNQWDSASPPGDIHRRIFDKSLMGLEMCSGSGAGSAADDRYDEQVELNHEQATNDWEYNWEAAQRAWNHQTLQNKIARANEDRALGYQEDVNDQAWLHQMQIREMQFNSDVAAYNKAETLYGAQVDYNQVAADLAYENEFNVVREQLQELQYKAEENLLKKGSELKSLSFKAEDSLNKATDVIDDLTSQGLGALNTYQSKRYSNQTQLNIKRSEQAFKGQSDTIKQIEALGKVRSRGTEGRSARKQQQSAVAAFGFNKALTAAALLNSERSFGENMDMLASEYSIGQSSRQNKYESNIKNYNLGSRMRSEEALNINRNFDLGSRQISDSRNNINIASQQHMGQIKHDQYGANLRADAQRLSEPTMGPEIPKPLDMPRSQLLDPMLPVNSEAPIRGASSGGVGAAQDRTQQNQMFGSLAGAALGAAAMTIPGVGIAAVGIGAATGGTVGGLF